MKMVNLEIEEFNYLKDRGFDIIKAPIKNEPYLMLNPEVKDDDELYLPQLEFKHKYHTGGLVYTNVHPNNSNLEDVLNKVEELVSKGLRMSSFSVPKGEKIHILVNDNTWNPVVEMLMRKYN